MTRADRAVELFAKGYNCCQAVAAAFAEDVKLPEDLLLRLASGFGGGFARTRGLCGTVSAMGMVIGLLREVPEGETANETNTAVYRLIQTARERFLERNGSDQCGELLKNIKNLTAGGGPEKRTPAYYAARPCVKLVVDAVEILEELFHI